MLREVRDIFRKDDNTLSRLEILGNVYQALYGISVKTWGMEIQYEDPSNTQELGDLNTVAKSKFLYENKLLFFCV